MALNNQVFLVDNLIKSAVISSTSTNAQYPLSNLKDDRRTKTFRSLSNSTTITLDFLTARPVNVLAFVDDGSNGLGFTACTLQLNNVDVWTSPAVSVSVSVDGLNGFAYAYLDNLANYRYARLVLTGTAGYVELSKVFIGESFQLGDLSFNYPLNFAYNNNATVSKNRLGQKFIDEINSYRTIAGSITTMTKEEVQPLLELCKYASFTRPIWLIFPEGVITEDNDQLNGYYYLKDDPSFSYVAGNFWNTSLSFEEGT